MLAIWRALEVRQAAEAGNGADALSARRAIRGNPASTKVGGTWRSPVNVVMQRVKYGKFMLKCYDSKALLQPANDVSFVGNTARQISKRGEENDQVRSDADEPSKEGGEFRQQKRIYPVARDARRAPARTAGWAWDNYRPGSGANQIQHACSRNANQQIQQSATAAATARQQHAAAAQQRRTTAVGDDGGR